MDKRSRAKLIDILKTRDNSINFLTKLILLNGSPLLLGCKPACTITFNNQGKHVNTLALWDTYNSVICCNSKLEFFELCRSSNHVLILMFDRKKLSLALSRHDISSFLFSLGYKTGSSVEEMLSTLKGNFIYSFPHEIGVFLGLPLKDVLGFMGLNDLELSCCRGWKIYGETESSMKLYRHYEKCKCKMVDMMINTTDIMTILNLYPIEQ